MKQRDSDPHARRHSQGITFMLALLAWSAGCRASSTESPMPWRSRVEYAPLVEKLRASGGDPARIHAIRDVTRLLQLETGRRYKFVVDMEGVMRVAPIHADLPNNEYVHPVLASGGPVQTGGSAWVTHDGREVAEVVLDADSKAFCPPPESLKWARAALERAGLPPFAWCSSPARPRARPPLRHRPTGHGWQAPRRNSWTPWPRTSAGWTWPCWRWA